MRTLKAAWQRIAGKRAYRPGTLYKAHRRQWLAIGVGDAFNISLRYGYDNVAWGRW